SNHCQAFCLSPPSAMPFLGKGTRHHLLLVKKCTWLTTSDETTRFPDHDNYHCKTKNQHAVEFGRKTWSENSLQETHFSKDFCPANHHDCRHCDADKRTHSTQNHDG